MGCLLAAAEKPRLLRERRRVQGNMIHRPILWPAHLGHRRGADDDRRLLLRRPTAARLKLHRFLFQGPERFAICYRAATRKLRSPNGGW
jgi:hypothetical protein